MGQLLVEGSLGIAALLRRCEAEPGFLAELCGHVASMRPLVDPARERASWRELIRELAGARW